MFRALCLLALLVVVQWPRPGRCEASLAAALVPIDQDLEQRIKLAQVTGVRFRFLSAAESGVRNAGEPVAPPCEDQSAAPQGGLCEINWRSAPGQWVSMLTSEHSGSLGQATVLLKTKSGKPLLLTSAGEVIVAIDLRHSDRSQSGARIRQWPYFNYVLYVAACHAKGVTPTAFARWQHSPLLGVHSESVWGLSAVALWTLCGLLFLWGRKPRPRLHKWSTRWIAALQESAHHPPKASDSEHHVSWNEIGFARPLSGFLTLLGAMFLLIGPYFALQSYLAGSVQPFPEADGLWKNTGDTLFIAWLTFDMGTQTAVVKYFAEHRPAHPEEALKDVQFYVWWQIAARTVEATLLIGVALRVLPYSSYALYAPFTLLYAVATLPAITSLPKLLCQAMQRFDYQNLLDFSEARVLSFLLPIPFILLGRSWGLSHPQYGEAFGAAIGMGVGGLATQFFVFSLGLYAVRKLGLPIVPMLLPQFDRQTALRQLSFGFKVTMGQEPFRLTSFLESLIIIRWLQDFPVWLGIRDMIHNRLQFLFFFAWSYYQSALPVVSEAMAGGKKKLIQYYIARYLQFGFLFSAVVFSLLAAVGPRYVAVALGAQWQGVADFLLLGCVSGLLLPLAWLSDSLQQGAGRPGTTTLVMLIEQGLRLLLLVLLVPRFQFVGIYFALNIALILKCAIGWWLNHRRIVPLQIPLRVTVLIPLCAGACNFLVWRGLVMLIAPTSWLTMMVLFFVAGAGSFVIGFFAVGLLGGIDRQATRELTQAATMSALVRPICEVLAGAAALGTRLSPWPATELSITEAALTEARELAVAAPKPPQTSPRDAAQTTQTADP
jgi:O-antigen/teichoic acid export membrane protein